MNISLILNTFNSIVLSYKSTIYYPYFSFYFIVGLRANQRLFVLYSGGKAALVATLTEH